MIKETRIQIKGKDYIVKFPTVGQLMDIESFKLSYTNGKYVDMALSMLNIHILTLDITDAISYFAILIPTLKQDLGVKNWRDIDTELAIQLVEIYKNQFIPWFKPIIEDLYTFDKKDDDEKQIEE
jgi:hypothetical protein